MLSPAHVVFLQKGWQALSGFVTALLVTIFLSPDEQGYYYAIGSLLSGYILLDLGLSGLLVQVSARMASGLEIRSGGGVAPLGSARSEFLAMIAWSQRWYVKTSAISLLLLPAGFLYFGFAKSGMADVPWQVPWTVVVVAVAFSIPAYPMQSIVEGVGRVSEVYWLRFIHYLLGGLMAWLLLVTGLGLFAPAMAPLSVALVSYAWWRSRYRDLFGTRDGDTSSFSWRESLWPLQRKVAISWFASYLFLNSPTLIVFYFGDASSAGRLGLSIVIANLLGSLCASWLIAKVPRITHLVAQERHGDSHDMFLREFRKALLLMFLGYAAAIVVVALLGDTFVGRRILPPVDLFLLFAVFLIFHSVGMLSVYFRARGRELLAMPTMVATLLGLVASMLIVQQRDVEGVLVAFLGAFVLVTLPGMYFAWARSRER